MASIEDQLTAFLAEELDVEPSELAGDDSLFDQGLLDSVGVLSIVAFIEETFDLELSAAEVNLENFDRISAMAALVRAKGA